MSLSITYPRTHEAHDSRNSITDEYVGFSATRDVPAKMLITDKEGRLIPCNYQYLLVADDHGVSDGILYVPSDEKPVNPETLKVIKREVVENENEYGGFDDFVRNLMHNPPAGVQFIKYNGVEEAIPPQEHWNFLGIKIAKGRRTRFVHSFSLCRLQAPFDGKYEAGIAEKKRQDMKRKSNLERLEQELSPLSLSEYLKMSEMSDQEISFFDIVPIEYSEEKTIPSGGSLPSIDEIMSLARKNFVKKTPYLTKRVVAVQEEIVEIPSTFWVRGKQRITYRGVALVETD